jgi:hypothetical protein
MNPQGWPAGTYFGELLEYGGISSVPQGRGQRNGQFGWPGKHRPPSVIPPARSRRERSDPIFSSAPQFGASGRVVEGPLCFFSAVRPSHPAPRHAHEGGNHLVCRYALGRGCFLAPRRRDLLEPCSQPRDLLPFPQQFILLESAFRPRFLILRLPARILQKRFFV